MKKDLKRTKNEMSLKDRTEILLVISVASDDMVQSVHMFPEVFYMDVTANTNKQKRDLFLMVVKDANREIFIGNATIIPFECHRKTARRELYKTNYSSCAPTRKHLIAKGQGLINRNHDAHHYCKSVMMGPNQWFVWNWYGGGFFPSWPAHGHSIYVGSIV
jgi:hypothetical protein